MVSNVGTDAIHRCDTLTRHTDKIHGRDTRTLTHFGTTWISFIPANHYQSSDYTKHSKPGYPKKHRTWLSAFYATIRVSTTYTISQLASCSNFFFPMLICSWHFHGQKYGTAKNASIRNRGDAYSPDTGHATRILLYISTLGIFRVAKYTTLKSVKWLLFSDLRVTQNVGDWNRTWHLVVSHPCPLVQPCCKCRNCCFFCSHVNLFLTFPWAKVRNR